jgi:putative oxidoreductase
LRFSDCRGVLLLLGLWTPVAGALAALAALAGADWQSADGGYCLMVGMLSLALALLGPGAWSVDARLFGWRRLEIRDPKKPVPPAE